MVLFTFLVENSRSATMLLKWSVLLDWGRSSDIKSRGNGIAVPGSSCEDMFSYEPVAALYMLWQRITKEAAQQQQQQQQ